MKQLKVVNALGGEVDLLTLKWPPDGDRKCIAVPGRVGEDGVILVIPRGVIDAETLTAGAAEGSTSLVGPSVELQTRVEGDADTMIESIAVEFNMEIRQHLEKRAPRSRRVLTWFGEANVLPAGVELDEQLHEWIEGGPTRLEEYQTAVEFQDPVGGDQPNGAPQIDVLTAHIARLEKQLQELQEHPQLRADPPPPRRVNLQAKVKPKKTAEVAEEDPFEDVRQDIRRAPGRLQDEPGLGLTVKGVSGRPAVEEENVTDPSLDDMFKMTMLKLMKDLQGKAGKKQKKLPGLASWEDSSSNDESTAWSSTSRGGRGIEAVERLRHAMKSHPEPYVDRMEKKMMAAVNFEEMDPSVPERFIKGCPVGKSRTAGYALQGFAMIHRLMLENKPKQAKLHTMRMIAAFEQFLIDESWTVASRVTGTLEPCWGEWAQQDVGALRRQYIYNRLSDATWMGALINELKEEEWLAKKRGGKGSGKTSDPKTVGKEGAAS